MWGGSLEATFDHTIWIRGKLGEKEREDEAKKKADSLKKEAEEKQARLEKLLATMPATSPNRAKLEEYLRNRRGERAAID